MDEFGLDTTVVNQPLVASISRILSTRKIPCVLWGNLLLTVFGVPTIVEGIDFVVPDELIQAAVSAIQETGRTTCTELKTCPTVREFRPSPAPADHFHINDESTLSFYKQSSTLWFLPSLTLSPSSHGTADIILASDSRLLPPRPGRGRGAFRPHLFPVCVPSPHRLLEAYIRLIARTHGRAHEYFYMAMVTYIWEYVDGDGLLDEASVEQRCRVFYEGFKTFEPPLAILLEELEANFTESADKPLVILPQMQRGVEEVGVEVSVEVSANEGPGKDMEVAGEVPVLNPADKAICEECSPRD